MCYTTQNLMTNVIFNSRTCAGIFIICFLVRKINTWTFGTTLQYIFRVWQCMIWLWICTHCCLCHIRCFGINIMTMWNDCIFICFIYTIFFFPRPSVLIILAEILEFFFNKDQSMILMMNEYFWQTCNIHNHTWPCILTAYF